MISGLPSTVVVAAAAGGPGADRAVSRSRRRGRAASNVAAPRTTSTDWTGEFRRAFRIAAGTESRPAIANVVPVLPQDVEAPVMILENRFARDVSLVRCPQRNGWHET